MTRKQSKRAAKPALKIVTARYFTEDIEEIKKRAADKFVPWQVELRLLVRRALKEQQLNILK